MNDRKKWKCGANIFKILLLIALCKSGYSQKYTVPRELAIPGYDEAIDTTGSSVPMLLTHLYPIGWSRNGKLACIALFDDHGDAYGYITFNFEIKNYRTGEVFYSHTDEQDEFPSDTPLDTIWKAHKKVFTELLEENAIIQCRFKLREFPVCTPSDTVNCRLYEHEVDMDSSPYGFPGIDSLVLSMESRKYGTEVICSDTGYIGLGASVPGYLDDPYSNAIILLLIMSHWGWEGPPNTTSIKLLHYSLK